MNTAFIIGLIIVFIFFFIVILILASYVKNRLNNPTPTNSNFIATQCDPTINDNVCGDDLICDSATYTCKVPNGGECNNYSDCLVGSYCSGVCTNSPAGGILEPCPCETGLTCSNNPSGGSSLVCLIVEGGPCNNDNECESQVCSSGTCQGSLQVGQVCTSNSQCGTNFCSPDINGTSVCQNPSTPSGTNGSNCQVALCNDGLTCYNETCHLATAGLNNVCNTNNFCEPPLVCLDPSGNPYNGNNSSNCYFNQESNTCVNECVFGFECKDGNCLGTKDQGCINDSTCVSNNCGLDNGTITIFNPGTLEYTPYTTLPNGLIPNDIYLDSSDNVYVNSSQGLFIHITSWQNVVSSTFTVSGVTYTFVTSCIYLSSYIFVGVNSGTYTVFTSSLSLFNGGVQKDTNNNNLSISHIDSDSSGNVLITTQGNNLFIKSESSTLYTNMNISTSQGKFYIENTPGYLSNVTFSGCNFGSVVFISPGMFYPNFQFTTCVNYSIVDFSFDQNGNIFIIAIDSLSNEYYAYIVQSGIQNKIPGYVNTSSRVAVGTNGFYLYSPGTCI